jgi:hypothetical protein
MPGALHLKEPADLLAKLEQESQSLTADHGNSYVAINALRDAYHLREWIWHGRLEHDLALQSAIMGGSGREDYWNGWVNRSCPDFPVIRELCNGSKHFEPGSLIRATHQAVLDSPIACLDTPYLVLDDASYYVEVGAGRLIPVVGLVTGARDFWRGLFAQFPQLA